MGWHLYEEAEIILELTDAEALVMGLARAGQLFKPRLSTVSCHPGRCRGQKQKWVLFSWDQRTLAQPLKEEAGGRCYFLSVPRSQAHPVNFECFHEGPEWFWSGDRRGKSEVLGSKSFIITQGWVHYLLEIFQKCLMTTLSTAPSKSHYFSEWFWSADWNASALTGEASISNSI